MATTTESSTIKEEGKVAEAEPAPEPAPIPEANTEPEPQAPANTTATQLPKTASLLPFVALLGFAALVLGFLTSAWQRSAWQRRRAF
jgi:hypothetical protein